MDGEEEEESRVATGEGFGVAASLRTRTERWRRLSSSIFFLFSSRVLRRTSSQDEARFFAIVDRATREKEEWRGRTTQGIGFPFINSGISTVRLWNLKSAVRTREPFDASRVPTSQGQKSKFDAHVLGPVGWAGVQRYFVGPAQSISKLKTF